MIQAGRRARRHVALGILTGLVLLLAAAASAEDAYVREIEDWHAWRIERLRQPTGWMTLVGLFQLPEGDRTFGSAPDNDLVFPASAPAHAGVFRNAEGSVTLDVEAGVTITHEDEPITTSVLRSDIQEDTTILTMGTLQFYVIERAGKQLLRLRDLEHSALKTFEGIARYPVSKEWRKVARFERFDPPRKLEIPDVLGNLNVEECPGAVVFEHQGQEYRLLPVWEGDVLFLVFADSTNGDETYGGGRSLYVDPPTEGDEVIVDFNKAYNPPCVFTPYATCALPLAENTLPLAIRAGEKVYHGYEP